MAMGHMFFATGKYLRKIPLRVTIIIELGGRSVALVSLTAASVILIGVSEIKLDFTSPEDAHGTVPLVQYSEFRQWLGIPVFWDDAQIGFLRAALLFETRQALFAREQFLHSALSDLLSFANKQFQRLD